jgi:hypothetical protein
MQIRMERILVHARTSLSSCVYHQRDIRKYQVMADVDNDKSVLDAIDRIVTENNRI